MAAWSRHPSLVSALLLGSALLGCTTRSEVSGGSLLRGGEKVTPAHHFDHVLVIVLENQTYSSVAADPYFAALAHRGAVFADFRGLFHPSYPNYLAMVSGRPIFTIDDRQRTVDVPTIGDALARRHLSFKNYAEDYPGRSGQCDLRPRVGRYARRHVPFLSFRSEQRADCAEVVPARQFALDVATRRLPAYAFYSPNLDHDGHDPVSDPKVGLRKAVSWLHGFLDPLLGTGQLPGTLVVLTFDESEGRERTNRIFTAFLGDMVRPGTVAGSYNHYNVLRTIEDDFGVAPVGTGDARARPIDGVWK